MIKNNEPVSFILFKAETVVEVWVQHAADFQDTFDYISQHHIVLAHNAKIDKFVEVFPIVLFYLLDNKLPKDTEYRIFISGASINQVKNDDNKESLDI